MGGGNFLFMSMTKTGFLDLIENYFCVAPQKGWFK
jgi:hypothetical protein